MALLEGVGRDAKSSRPQSSVDGSKAEVDSAWVELVEESKGQSSSIPAELDLDACDDEKEVPPARESSPAQAVALCSGTAGCWITCALTLAAFSAMVSLALLELLPNEPESISPNASPEVVATLPLVRWAGTAVLDDGVRERGPDEIEPEAASIVKASYFGRGLVDDDAGLAPSLRGGSEGFKGAEVFQRSAKESAIVIDRSSER